jgi:hypothetical protein
MSMELTLMVLAGAALGLLFYRRRNYRPGDIRAATSKPERNYWGVRVIAPAEGPACAAIRKTGGRGFKLERVPTLPLPGCDLQVCRCRFDYLPERRAGAERRFSEDRRGAIRFDSERSDRRSGHDRRVDNDAWNWIWS